MRRKLRRRTGFTLTETLITIMILALVTAAGAAGVTAVLAVRNRMIQVADAQILASTAAEAIADELRFGRKIKVDGAQITMDSSLFDTGSTLRLSADPADPAGGDTTTGGKALPVGRLVVERKVSASDTQIREVLGERSYDDLHFKALTFTQGETDDHDDKVTVALTVADAAGHELWSATFDVVPLNGVTS